MEIFHSYPSQPVLVSGTDDGAHAAADDHAFAANDGDDADAGCDLIHKIYSALQANR